VSTAIHLPSNAGPAQPSPAELEARSAFLEVTAGFFAALGAGVAGSFINDKTAPHWLVLILFILSFALGLGVMVWLGAVYGRLKADRTGAALPPRRVTSASRVWAPLIAFGTALVVILTGATFWLGAHADPDFSSVYDGQDPDNSGCRDSTTKSIWGADKRATLLDFNDQPAGHIELYASPKCGTLWAELLVDEAARERVKGQVVRLVMIRPEDGDEEPYPLRLHGGAQGHSNMISAVESCAVAQAYFTSGESRGPVAETDCKLEEL
jgi:hypothetical protein